MESSKHVDEILTLLSEATDNHLDNRICKDLKELIGKPINEVKTGVMKAIDYSVAFGLASQFTLIVLNDLYTVFLHGKQDEFNDENCPWRKEMYGNTK